MNIFMPWETCEKEFIRRVSPDKEKMESLIEMALQRKSFLEVGPVSEKTVSFVVEGLYEVIKELLVALLLKNGLRSSNHQCIISYFYKEFPQYEFEAHLLAQLCYLRNRLDYYGEAIDAVFYEKNEENIQKLIEILVKLTKQ